MNNKIYVTAWMRDFCVGIAVIVLAGVIALLQHLPVAGSAILTFLIFGIAGAFIHLLLSLAFSTKKADFAGIARSLVITGVLAVCAGSREVWSAPTQWLDLIQLSVFGSALFIVIYHLANGYILISQKRSVGLIGSILILGVPYVSGLLLLLQSGDLLKSLFGYAFIGRVAVLFLVNEFTANAFALITRKRGLRGIAVHGWLALPAVAVVAAPFVADSGSGSVVAEWPAVLRSAAAVAATSVSQAALWAEAFLLTGIMLSGMQGAVPDRNIIAGNVRSGMVKGAVFSAILMGLIQLTGLAVSLPLMNTFYKAAPVVVLMVSMSLVFPLFKTIIESFDGSHSFFGRALRAWSNPVLYGRGAVVGLALAIAIGWVLPERTSGFRMLFGAVAGLSAFAGISLLRDIMLKLRRRGRIKSIRFYLVESCLGIFIGAALAFYFDVSQLPILLAKFKVYTSFGLDPNALVDICNSVRTTRPDEFRALLNNWGYIRLSVASGGAKVLFNEALIGVSVWGVAAWLFAVNKAFLQALFDKSWSTVKRIPSREGIADMVEGTIRVMRWGLWMSPVIFTFLRPMGTPTWYNQDGAVRTVFASVNRIFMDGDAFNEWSLGVFLWILVYSGFRILIFVDHMGLRVATMVNLSFIGMDRLDEKLARFIGPDAAARFIPEGVKRFTTWAPLLIPFYLPAGAEWDRVWNESRAMLAAANGGNAASLTASAIAIRIAVALCVVLFVTLISHAVRMHHMRMAEKSKGRLRIANLHYEVELKLSGEINSRLFNEGVTVTRPAYEGIDPAGRALFLTEIMDDGTKKVRPVLGNYPQELFEKAVCSASGGTLTAVQESDGLKTTLTVSLPDENAAVERWDISVENLSDRPRKLKLSPYLEWLLNGVEGDRNHTQYNRLYPEMSYDTSLNAILALHRHTNKVGLLASASLPEGFLTGRVDFIGRAGTIWNPRVLQTLDFMECRDTDAYPTFDPIGALLLDISIEAKSSSGVSLLIGCADSKYEAADWIRKHLTFQRDKESMNVGGKPVGNEESLRGKRSAMIGHGEVLPNTPLPYTEYEEGGGVLHVRTPFTPRPFDHTMANAGGHVLCVTNRGLHTSASGNAQQNRLTTDWADLVGREMPSEAFYLYEAAAGEWYSPTYEPLRDAEAEYDVRFGLDGSAVFKMRKGWIETELTVHVPVADPTGVYQLTIRNMGTEPRQLRVAPYFQIALAHSPEMAEKLNIESDSESGALFFENPSNSFRSGPAFIAMTEKASVTALSRGAFFGRGRSFAHPVMVENGAQDSSSDDKASCAALMAEVEIPPQGEVTVAVVLGQADTRSDAEACIRKFSTVDAAKDSLIQTRAWWKKYVSTLKVDTSDAEFNGYVDWMKYQALAERIWARKGFYQASGAFGFRDQLQDSVNLIWVDPVLARKQLILNAAQQFREGDVTHWFFQMQDGRTGFVSRSHASDNLLWLGWGVSEYVRMTGDKSLLDEQVTYLDSEVPLPPLPQGKHGMGFCPLRSPVSDTVYAHVMCAIDLVFEKRMGEHGLPLIGTGDWNDGLDEIGSEGRGESVWLAFFLCYILNNFLGVIEERSGIKRREYYEQRLKDLKEATEKTWRGDRYLRAIHDDGTEIGVEGAGYWETDALTASWAVYADMNGERSRTAVDTALRILEDDNIISLGYPPLRADTKPFLGRSSYYPEGVRENGMYSHGVQWLVRACRLLSEKLADSGDSEAAAQYRNAATRLWFKISAISHVTPDQIEIYGGQPNKQCADYLTKYDPGRMIWNGYTGAAAWMLRQAVEGVMGYELIQGEIKSPADIAEPRGDVRVNSIERCVAKSPL